MHNQTIIAIDPGLKGVLASFEIHSDNSISLIHWGKLPVVKDTSILDVHRLVNLISLEHPDFMVIERAYDGGSSRSKGARTIMLNYGRILASAEVLWVGYDEVSPRSWQAYIKKQVQFAGDTKALAIEFAQRKMGLTLPMTSSRANARVDDGFADAACLAYWAVNVLYKGDK